MKRLTVEIGSITAAVAAAVYLGAASCGSLNTDERQAAYCAEGKVRPNGGPKSALMDAKIKYGLAFSDGAAEEVARRLPPHQYENTTISLGLTEDGKLLAARVGSCAVEFPDVPTLPLDNKAN